MRTFWWLAAGTLAIAFALGGATKQGSLGDVIAQLAAIPLLLAALWMVPDASPAARRAILAAFGILGAFALLQFGLALSGIFSAGRAPDLSAENLALLSAARGGAGVVSPQATLAALVSFIVPAAIFGATALMAGHWRVRLAYFIVALGTGGLLLGMMQVAQGPESALRFYEVTNRADAVGTFANRNHFAAMLYVTLVLSSLWFIDAARHALAKGGDRTVAALALTAGALLVVAVIAGIALSRSRAGLLLTMAGLGGVMLLVMLNRPGRDPKGKDKDRRKWALGITAVAIAALLVAQLGLARLVQRFGQDQLKDMRVVLSETTLETALATLPFGTGLGSFVEVYATMEKSADLFQVFANRAHNDYLELLLEAGLPGAALVALFIAFWAWRTLSVWAWPQADANPQDIILQRAASIAIALILLHSLVDYPLRTTGMAAVFAFAAAALLPVTALPKTERRRAEPPEDVVPLAPPKPSAELGPLPGLRGKGDVLDDWKNKLTVDN
jgi:O-antigen ligase